MTYDEPYLDFYDAYPRKEGKADGFKAWCALSQTDQKAAAADVAKRKRMGAYSSNKKLIQLPASYLRARRWEDDWQDTLESSRRGDDLPNSGIPVPKVGTHVPDLPWRERLINRCFRAYMYTSISIGGLPEVASALQLKRELLREAEVLTEPPEEQAVIIANLFMNRMDHLYGKTIGAAALRQARQLK